MRRVAGIAAVFLLAVWVAPGASAQEAAGAGAKAEAKVTAKSQAAPWSAGGEPIEIDAKTMELRGNERLAVFEGSVVAVRGDLTLNADRVELRTADKARQIETIEATGRVRIKKGDMVASGAAAHYDVAAAVIVLTGEPTVWRGRDAVQGERIVFHVNDERVQVENARAILHTDSQAPNGGEAQ